MAEFFPANKQAKKPTIIAGIAPRFIRPGDTPEQSLERQRQAMQRLGDKAYTKSRK